MLARLLRDQAEAQNDISSAQKRKSEVRDNRILSLKTALAKCKPKSKPDKRERGSTLSQT
jgi:hypothetical protein